METATRMAELPPPIVVPLPPIPLPTGWRRIWANIWNVDTGPISFMFMFLWVGIVAVGLVTRPSQSHDNPTVSVVVMSAIWMLALSMMVAMLSRVDRFIFDEWREKQAEPLIKSGGEELIERTYPMISITSAPNHYTLEYGDDTIYRTVLPSENVIFKVRQGIPARLRFSGYCDNLAWSAGRKPRHRILAEEFTSALVWVAGKVVIEVHSLETLGALETPVGE